MDERIKRLIESGEIPTNHQNTGFAQFNTYAYKHKTYIARFIFLLILLCCNFDIDANCLLFIRTGAIIVFITNTIIVHRKRKQQ